MEKLLVSAFPIKSSLLKKTWAFFAIVPAEIVLFPEYESSFSHIKDYVKDYPEYYDDSASMPIYVIFLNYFSNKPKLQSTDVEFLASKFKKKSKKIYGYLTIMGHALSLDKIKLTGQYVEKPLENLVFNVPFGFLPLSENLRKELNTEYDFFFKNNSTSELQRKQEKLENQINFLKQNFTDIVKYKRYENLRSILAHYIIYKNIDIVRNTHNDEKIEHLLIGLIDKSALSELSAAENDLGRFLNPENAKLKNLYLYQNAILIVEKDPFEVETLMFYDELTSFSYKHTKITMNGFAHKFEYEYHYGHKDSIYDYILEIESQKININLIMSIVPFAQKRSVQVNLSRFSDEENNKPNGLFTNT